MFLLLFVVVTILCCPLFCQSKCRGVPPENNAHCPNIRQDLQQQFIAVCANSETKSCYYYSSTKVATQEEAKELCQQLNGTLPSFAAIGNDADVFDTQLPDTDYYWTGLCTNSDWLKIINCQLASEKIPVTIHGGKRKYRNKGNWGPKQDQDANNPNVVCATNTPPEAEEAPSKEINEVIDTGVNPFSIVGKKVIAGVLLVFIIIIALIATCCWCCCCRKGSKDENNDLEKKAKKEKKKSEKNRESDVSDDSSAASSNRSTVIVDETKSKKSRKSNK